jgi:glutamate-1-semialdehyde 2,1-aminomutase
MSGPVGGLAEAVEAWRRDVEAEYVARRPRSAQLNRRLVDVLPGGDTRFSVTLEPFSTFFVEAHGQELIDADGNRYLDLANNATSLIHGHAHPRIVDAATRQVARGSAWIGPNPFQVELAEELVERVPSFEKVRFTNSGTEANNLMVKVARAFTGRDLILKMGAAYHGSGDLFEFGPAPEDGRRAAPLMAGVPENLANNVVIGRFNDADFTVDLIERYAGVLAAVIVTPVLSVGMVEPAPGFLEAIRDAAHRVGALLLFDEVISLRVARGGAQERYGVVPDLTAVAKIIGGGFPVGAFGGREDVMAMTDPTLGARVMHAGTFNGNPVTMAAGLESVRMLTPEAFEGLERTGEALERGLRAVIDETGVPMVLGRAGSLLFLDLAPPADDR